MPKITLKEILKDANSRKYAVGAFNVVDSHFLEAIVKTAEECSSPVILNIAEVHFPYFNISALSAMIQKRIEQSIIPITLNLDHGLTMENIKIALDCGFSSIMYDGSHLEFEKNIEQTRIVVELCKSYNVSVESELGAVGGAEGGELVGEADPLKYTDIEQAKIFVKETGVDALAVAIGNSHGKYKGEPKLDFDRLKTLNSELGIPLVLHGGSGISEDDFKKAIKFGISKINFFTGMSQAALQTAKEFFNGTQEKYNNYLLMNQKIEKSIKDIVIEQMNIFGSIGRV